MHPAEQIAKDTWGRLKQSRELQVRLGEETLTYLLVLEFKRLMGDRTKLFQSTKFQESKRGTDVEMRIHAGGNRAIAFALQAKKLKQDEGYRGLETRAKSSDTLQLDMLEKYAEKVRAVPFYLLYIYVCLDDLHPYWHCRGRPDEDHEQLGCSVVPSCIIRQAIRKKRGRRNFDWIHKSGAALPWRCLFNCPHQCTLRYDCEFMKPVDGGWPEWLWSRNSTTFSNEDVEILQEEISRREISKRHFEQLAIDRADVSSVADGELPGYVILIKETLE